MKSCTMLFSQFLLVAFLFCSDLLHNYPHKDNNLQAHLQHQFREALKKVNNYEKYISKSIEPTANDE